MSEVPALADPRLTDLPHEVVIHGPVRSLEEAAAARGVPPSKVLKTMVVRRGANDYLFVLVPGDRNIAWPKLREHLGVNRISMPDSEEALEVTGYIRGTITPFAAKHRLPVIADESMTGRVSIGGGARGVSLTVESSALIEVLDAVTADVTEPV